MFPEKVREGSIATKARLEDAIRLLRKQKGGIKSDRTKFKNELRKTEIRFSNASKRSRIFRSEKTDLKKMLSTATRKSKRLEKKLSQFIDERRELRRDLDASEKSFLKMQEYTRKYVAECDELKRYVERLKGIPEKYGFVVGGSIPPCGTIFV